MDPATPPTAPAASPPDSTLSLAGEWRLHLAGPPSIAAGASLPALDFDDTITLPATTETAGRGPLNPVPATNHLTAVRRHVGPAWYERAFVVPEAWRGRRVTLHLERTKPATVWLDGRTCGENFHLCTPQEYPLGPIEPGPHRLTVCVDNSRLVVPGDNHQVSEHTQGNWNGMLGRLELRSTGPVWLDRIEIRPDLAARRFRLRIAVGGAAGAASGGTLSVRAESCNHPGPVHRPAPVVRSVAADSSAFALDLALGDAARLWDEFSPALYRVTIELQGPGGSDRRELTTGLRAFTASGTQFAVNGRPTFLRGEVNCCVFPLTGHPPMAVGGWKESFRLLLEHGLNHVRFHSWTPPEAAFAAADELGIYLQTELPFWGEWHEGVRAALQPEGEAILHWFGHHPSFVLLTLGNEHRGDRAVLAATVAALRRQDPTRLYAEGSNNFLTAPAAAPADDFWITARLPTATPGRFANVRGSFATNDGADGHLQVGPGGTRPDYTAAIAGLRGPVISHEVGQYAVAPDFHEIARHTGVFRAHNLERFHAKAAAAGLLARAPEFLAASGKLAALCYREEIEAALRTPGFGGFQLLGLQDFPGQGTALVGLRDVFLAGKGAISPAEFSRFCAARVLLARFDRHVWTGGERFTADIVLAQYGPCAVPAGRLDWKLRNAAGEVVGHGHAGVAAVPPGGAHPLATIGLDLPAGPRAMRCTLELAHAPSATTADYPLWIYPAAGPAPILPATVVVARQCDTAALAALAAGSRVLLLPDAAHPFAHSPGGGFTTDFWCWPMFFNRPGTLGLLVTPDHPALAGFPSDFHSDWQWFHLARASQPLVLDGLPTDLQPIVAVIDNLERVHRLGLLFEARVGPGRLLVCAVDLPALAPAHPEARHLFNRLLAYAASDDFLPAAALAPDVVARVLEARLPLAGARFSASASGPHRDPFAVQNQTATADRTLAAELIGEWWQVDFDQPVDLDAVELAWDRAQGPYDAAIEATFDAASWRKVAGGSAGAAPRRYHRLECAVRGARGLRMRITGLPAEADRGLGELRLIPRGS